MQSEDKPPSSAHTDPHVRAVEYVRMSTEHQQYSTENQADKIREYAARRNIEIVRTYADEGKSGLRIDGRRALQRLIHDVESGAADFKIILVYDVILTLIQHGEERLLVAVERGEIPLNAALSIVGAGDNDKAIQAALQEAYEAGTLRGRNLLEARRVIERRKSLGRSVARATARTREPVTSSSLVRTYQKEVERQKQMVRKAEFAQQRWLFLVSALRQLLSDENFINLLRAEGLDTLPKQLSERVWA